MNQPPRLQMAADTSPLQEFASARAKLVYLYLSVTGGATVDDLKQELDMQRLDLFGVLGNLCERDRVRRDGERYVPA